MPPQAVLRQQAAGMQDRLHLLYILLRLCPTISLASDNVLHLWTSLKASSVAREAFFQWLRRCAVGVTRADTAVLRAAQLVGLARKRNTLEDSWANLSSTSLDASLRVAFAQHHGDQRGSGDGVDADASIVSATSVGSGGDLFMLGRVLSQDTIDTVFRTLFAADKMDFASMGPDAFACFQELLVSVNVCEGHLAVLRTEDMTAGANNATTSSTPIGAASATPGSATSAAASRLGLGSTVPPLMPDLLSALSRSAAASPGTPGSWFGGAGQVTGQRARTPSAGSIGSTSSSTGRRGGHTAQPRQIIVVALQDDTLEGLETLWQIALRAPRTIASHGTQQREAAVSPPPPPLHCCAHCVYSSVCSYCVGCERVRGHVGIEQGSIIFGARRAQVPSKSVSDTGHDGAGAAHRQVPACHCRRQHSKHRRPHYH